MLRATPARSVSTQSLKKPRNRTAPSARKAATSESVTAISAVVLMRGIPAISGGGIRPQTNNDEHRRMQRWAFISEWPMKSLLTCVYLWFPHFANRRLRMPVVIDEAQAHAPRLALAVDFAGWPPDGGSNHGDLWQRLWFTLGALIVYQLSTFLSIPGIDPIALSNFFHERASGILGLIDL